MRKLLTWALWLILILAVIGVGYFAWRYFTGGDEPPVGEQVNVTCSKECAERAQCGTLVGGDESPVVLGNQNSPTVAAQAHDAFFPSGASVEIRDAMDVTLKDVDGREFKQTFSRVRLLNPIGDIAETAWIPDWCIERP
jgi:hypothetical protein